MKAIFRHELSSHFQSVTGYVFGAFMLLFTGIYCMVINLKVGYANFEYVLGSMSFVYIIGIPILTMRTIADERKQKTDQLLYSLPLTMTKVVVGKYLVLLIMLLIPTAIIAFYPLILTAFGSVYLPAAYGTLVGFFFLGAALAAIGMFVSSLMENQASAAGLCFAIILMDYFISSLAGYVSTTAFASFIAYAVVLVALGVIVRLLTKNTFAAIMSALVPGIALVITYGVTPSSFEGSFPAVMEQLSLFDRFYVFSDGVFDIRALVFFASIVMVFLFLSVQSMEKRRWNG
ncbi:MAG TPA: ABC transporter permease subunit [Candidatus Limiplasma sp.]|nr:ABC transporter permease subunit [Candidatus Limiplasma sp.]